MIEVTFSAPDRPSVTTRVGAVRLLPGEIWGMTDGLYVVIATGPDQDGEYEVCGDAFRFYPQVDIAAVPETP